MRSLSGAIHPNTSNYSRTPRLDIVSRTRRLVQSGVLDRPAWLTAVERAPPMDLRTMRFQNRSLRSPYFSLVRDVLARYPDLRFADCFVQGNDWSKGNDTYRVDHPVMQFVARQLRLMNKGVSKGKAFEIVASEMRGRRESLEAERKIQMALAVNAQVAPVLGSQKFPTPLFTKAEAVARQDRARMEILHLRGMRGKLQRMRDAFINEERRWKKKPLFLRPDVADLEVQRIMLLERGAPVRVIEALAEAEAEEHEEEEAFEEEEEEVDYASLLERVRRK